MSTASANVGERPSLSPVLDTLPEFLELAEATLVIANQAYNSAPLRAELKEQGFELLSPHRSNRAKPACNDGRRMRRYGRRWIVERTLSWLHHLRRLLVPHEYYSIVYDGFVPLAIVIIILRKL